MKKCTTGDNSKKQPKRIRIEIGTATASVKRKDKETAPKGNINKTNRNINNKHILSLPKK